MKKILGLLLCLGIVSGAFAQQLTMSMSFDFIPELVRYTSNMGDWGDVNSNFFRGRNTLDILSSTSEDNLSKPTEARIGLNYNNGRGITANLVMSLDNYFRGSGLNDGTGGFLEGEDIDVSFATLLSSVFTEWFVRGTFGMYTAYVGRTNDRGKVARFNTGFDELTNSMKLDNYSVLTPEMGNNGISSYSPSPFNSLSGIDNNNLLRQMQLSDRYRRYNQPYFSFSVNPKPFTFQIAGDLGDSSGIASLIAGESYYRFNGAFRISGERIANRVTFDAIYKFRGGDPRTLDTYNDPQGDGMGVSVHSFGVYANILGVPGFGIGLGYTGLLRSYEDKHSRYGDYEKRITPFFNGIDFRGQYTGIPQLTITSHNNVSFAVTRATNDPKKQVMPMEGSNTPLNMDEGETWVALLNALSFNYRWTRQLTVSAQVINRFGSLVTNADGSKDSKVHNKTVLVAAAGFRFTPNILLQTGLQCMFHTYTETNTSEDAVTGQPAPDIKASRLYFAIPLRFRINF